MASTYHHGNLRAQVLSSAVDMIASDGPDTLSLRELARQAGVSHAAPAHHFGDRQGLFTAVAADGFELMAQALEPSVKTGRFDRTAVAYVRFAVAHRGHFAVMFRPDLLDRDEERLASARRRTSRLLGAGLESVPDASVHVSRPDARRAAWALVHGVATLWLAGELPDTNPERVALSAAHQLFAKPGQASG